MDQEICPIWGLDASIASTSRDGVVVNSLRAGGKYFISRNATLELRNSDTALKARLTTWLVDQRKLGTDCPEVLTTTLANIKTQRFLGIIERRDRVLEWIESRCSGLGRVVLVDQDTVNAKASKFEYWTNLLDLCANCEAKELTEARELIDFCKKSGMVEGSPRVSLTFEGHIHVEKIRHAAPVSSQAFVAMWFGAEMQDAYSQGFEPGIRDAGYQPMRIDRKEHNNKIDDEIIAEIRRSKFLVADFTCGLAANSAPPEAIARGGVYFEAGFARGLGREVIWTCRADRISYVHFDTRQFNHILWSEFSDLRRQISLRISAVIGDGPLKLAG